MDNNTNNYIAVRQINRKMISQNIEVEKVISNMRVIEKFLNDFGFLTFGRDSFFHNNHAHFGLQIVSTSCELTAGSIISCCESGCLADAYSLLRKYRDDLFFYLYVEVNSAYNQLQTADKDKINDNIGRWLKNDLKDLYIVEVLKTVGQSPHLKDAVKKYNLKASFDKIANKLNNFVHSNGISFYNRNVNMYHGDDLQNHMQALLEDMRYITVSFLFLLTLCSPSSIMSTEYLDCLGLGLPPTEGSEHWVEPFIIRFFKSNLDLIDESCMDYLRDNTPMEFD